MIFKITMQNPRKLRTFIFYENFAGNKIDAIELLTRNSLKKVDQLFKVKNQINRFSEHEVILTIEQMLDTEYQIKEKNNGS